VKPLLKNNPKTILFCAGCLSALAMAPVYAWPIMAFGYSLLLYYLVKLARGPVQTAIYAFLFFFGYYLVGLYWTSSSLFVEIEHWWWALPLSFAGLPLLLCIAPTALFALTGLITRYRVIPIMAVLIVMDMIRSVLFTGFPWNMPIHGFLHNDTGMALLPIIGFYPLNALIVIFSCIPAFITLYLKQYKMVSVVVFATFALLTELIPLGHSPSISSIPSNVIMVQANIPQKEKWVPQYIERNLDRYINMSREAVTTSDPYIIIWPETAISQSLLTYPELQQKFYSFLNNLPDNSYLITGYLYQTQEGYFNALAVLDKNGEINDIYNKHHLVPFGEYMPLGLDTITGVSNFRNGPIPKNIELTGRNFQFLPLICYEIIFSSYANNANPDAVILNITNDAWFGKTAGPYQHFDHAILRAIENKKVIFRLSGNGLSGIILPDGKVANLTGLNHTDVIKTR
tara:strand:+ start:291 stop:1661 length:1371 start_codon:yes stop_codon:yes gene_type:complete